jgi:hypothetical protein
MIKKCLCGVGNFFTLLQYKVPFNIYDMRNIMLPRIIVAKENDLYAVLLTSMNPDRPQVLGEIDRWLEK